MAVGFHGSIQFLINCASDLEVSLSAVERMDGRVRVGAAAGSFADPRVWRQVSRPLLAALHRGEARRPSLATDVRRRLVEQFRDDVALLETLLGRSFQDWLGDSGRGTYAVRTSLAPSEREASQ